MKVVNKNSAFRKINKLVPSSTWGHLDSAMLGERRSFPNALGLDTCVQMGYYNLQGNHSKTPELCGTISPKVVFSIGKNQDKSVRFYGQKKGWKVLSYTQDNWPTQDNWLDEFLKRHFNSTQRKGCYVYDEDAPAKFLETLSTMPVSELAYHAGRRKFRKGFDKRLTAIIDELESKENPTVRDALGILERNGGIDSIIQKYIVEYWDDDARQRLANEMLKLYAVRMEKESPRSSYFPWGIGVPCPGQNIHIKIGNKIVDTAFQKEEPILQMDLDEARKRLYDIRNEKPLSDLELATIVFSDCRSNGIRALPEKALALTGAYCKVPETVVQDAKLMKALLDLERGERKTGRLYAPFDYMTECHKLEGDSRDIFAKRLDAPKVPYCDYELDMASRLHEKGIDVQKPIGLAYLAGAPWALFEYANNAISLAGFDSSYQPNHLAENLQNHEAEIYQTLGRYVRKMLDKGAYDKDMAKRNFMAQFKPTGELERVFMVDYEKTHLNRNLSQEERETALRQLAQSLSESESGYFKRGYESPGK